MLLILNDIKSAKFLLTAKVIAVDIETRTDVPEGSNWKSTFGVGNSTDITHISFYTKNHPPVVFTMPPVEGSYYPQEGLSAYARLEEQAKVEFVKEIMSNQDRWRMIAHNASFDGIRMGTHYGFYLSPACKVWDTMVMARLLLTGESNKDLAQYTLGLDAQLELYGRGHVFYPETDTEFYSLMKNKYRKDFGALTKDLATLLVSDEGVGDSPLLAYVGGDLDEAKVIWGELLYAAHVLREEYEDLKKAATAFLENPLLPQAASSCISHYVAMDTVYTYRLYEKQVEFASLLFKGSGKMGEVLLPVWSQLRELLAKEQKIARVVINQGIRGVPIDKPYIEKRLQGWKYEHEILVEEFIAKVDPTDPDPSFLHRAGMIYWYSRVLDKKRSKAQYSKPTTWVNWQPIDFDFTDLQEHLEHPDGDKVPEIHRAAWAMEWASWLCQLPLDVTGHAILKEGTLPASKIPKLDFVKFIYDSCFQGAERGWELAQYKANWYSIYFNRTKSTNWTTPADMFSKKAWQPYYLFCVAGIPFPTSSEIYYTGDLVTGSHKKTVKALNALMKIVRKGGNPQTPGDRDLYMQPWFSRFEEDDNPTTISNLLEQGVSAKKIYVNHLKVALATSTFAMGKKAVDWYLPEKYTEDKELNPEYQDHPGRPYYDIMQYTAWIRKAIEFLTHAERDGRIHSVMSRSTRSSRFSSKNPNLQNIRMEDYAGFLTAIPGHLLNELDYSNAENVTGAMVSGDNAFAMSVAEGDYHFNRASIYFREDMLQALKDMDKSLQKSLRGAGKAITFAEAYGATAHKLSVETKRPLEEINEILAKLHAAFPHLYLRKDQVSDQIKKLYEKGITPYVTVWSGARMRIPLTRRYGKIEPKAYVGWNLLQQGGVAEMIAPAMVYITEWLEENNMESYVALNVHDSIILSLKLGEEDVVFPAICEILGEIVPLEKRKRTVPRAHLVAAVGSENAFKWGHQGLAQDNIEQTYPLGFERHWNRYGVFDYDDDEMGKPFYNREAPVWRGDISQGWTLEQEMIEDRAEKLQALLGAEEEMSHEVLPTSLSAWAEISEIYDELLENQAKYEISVPEGLLAPKTIRIPTMGENRTLRNLPFEEYAAVSWLLYQRGYTGLFVSTMETVACVLQHALTSPKGEDAAQWYRKYDTMSQAYRNLTRQEETA